MALFNELAEEITLDGVWQFSFPRDAGDGEKFGTIQSPGCWEAQGYSMFVEGPARYQRSIFIPASWAGQRILLEFDAFSYACTIFCNGRQVGEHVGMWAPFAVDLTGAARCGADNTIELIAYKPGKRYPMRSCLAGFLPDVATPFGGMWQPARLSALRCALRDVAVEADYESRSIQVRCQADLYDIDLAQAHWQVKVERGEQTIVTQDLPYDAGGELHASLPVPSPVFWSPEQPSLYAVTLQLLADSGLAASLTRRVGFRRLSADGQQLLLNGEPFMVRGILSWGWNPDRIAPFYTPEQARTEFRQAREMGFNLIKLCLFVPNHLYFDIADEEGMLLWEELPMWLPQVNDHLRAQAPLEYAEIAALTAPHPSVVLYSLGCELSQSVDDRLLGELNQAVRGRVHDVLLCDNSGSGESYGGLDFDFADFTDYHPYYDLNYFDPLLDNWRRDWQPPRPWIFGEFCDSDTFRDLGEIIQANGGNRPWWLTCENPVTAWRSESQAMLEWEERLIISKPGFSREEIKRVSYQQSYVVRKYTLEALRRRRGIGGYVITGLRDTPISTSGVWDDFGHPKWLPEDFRQINGEAVLSLDVGRRRTWRYGGDRPDPLDPYNHWSGDPARWYVILNPGGQGFSTGARLDWSLTSDQGAAIASGSSQVDRDILPGIPTQAGTISCALPVVDRPAELCLSVTLEQDGRLVSNRWPVWVYPREDTPPQGLGVVDPTGVLADSWSWVRDLPHFQAGDHPGAVPVLVSTALDDTLWRYIQDGGRVLLLQQGEAPLPARRCPFWREAIKLFPEHPLWNTFPQHGFTGMQFFGLSSDIAFDTSRLAGTLPAPVEIRLILRRLDAREFFMADYLFEASAGPGRLVACALRLAGGTGGQPSGEQRNVAGNAMLRILLRYLAVA